jgi:hypothetical protein
MAGLLAVALLALPSPAAGDGPSPGVAAAQSGPKDYSRNAATGDFASAREAAAAAGELRTSSLAGTSSPPRPERPSVDNPWPEIGAGFVGGFLVAGDAAILAGRTRRARMAA